MRRPAARRYERALLAVGEEIAAVFSIHAILLEDEEFISSVLTLIRERGVTAEHAVYAVGEELGEAFFGMESNYMRARAMDIRDISCQVIRLLLERVPENPLREGPAILVANEFLPSEIIDLDHSRLLGIIAHKGNVESHAAMLLRAYGIPAMTEVALERDWDGHLALLDGFDHKLYLDPDPSLLDTLRLRYQQAKGGLEVNKAAAESVQGTE